MDLSTAKTPILITTAVVSAILFISYLHVSDMFRKPDKKES